MSQSALRAPAFALAACRPLAAHAAEALTGAYALLDGRPKVGATLVATPGRGGVERHGGHGDAGRRRHAASAPGRRPGIARPDAARARPQGGDLPAVDTVHDRRQGPDGAFRRSRCMRVRA